MIIDVKTNEEVAFHFRPIGLEEIKEKKYHKKGGWLFNWGDEIKAGRDVFAIVVSHKPDEIQGLISLKALHDPIYLAVMVYLIETAKVNRFDSDPRYYEGVGETLVAFACKYSVDQNLEGYVQLQSKSSTLPFYKKLNAIVNPASRVCTFEEPVGQALAKKFFKGGSIIWAE